MTVNGKSKILLYVFFIAILAAPYFIANYGDWKKTTGPNVDRQAALDRYGFYLEDVTSDWGINFTHHAPELDPKLDHIMPQVASVGAAVSVVDFNNDGWQDFYITNSAHNKPNALYKNLGDGNFKDVASQMGIANINNEKTGVSMSAVWADYDNDGYEDLFVSKWGKPALYHNDNGNGFTKVDVAAFPDWVNANTAVWFDYDQDGLLDLLLGSYFHQDINLWDLNSTEIMPESFEYAKNGGRLYLFHNLGNGTFEEVSKALGLISNRWSYAAASADIDGSGYPDLVIANDYGVDEIFFNQQGNRFFDAGNKAGMGFAPKSGMNVSFGDIMNQGELAIYVTNISEPGILIQGNNLWVPTSGNEKDLSFKNLANAFGIEQGGWSYGAQFGDLNLDGHLDLYVANGYVSAEKGTDYWYDFSKVAGGNRAIIADAQNWPAMDGRTLSGYQDNKIWVNDGSGKFSEVAEAVGGAIDLDSRAVAFADLNNNGTLEILVASQKAPFRIFKSTVQDSRNWISFKLQGTISNSSAIGAKVELVWDSNRQVQVVHSASGFSSQNQRPVHFGIGEAEQVEKAIITWPSGQIDTLATLEINRIHNIKENERPL